MACRSACWAAFRSAFSATSEVDASSAARRPSLSARDRIRSSSDCSWARSRAISSCVACRTDSACAAARRRTSSASRAAAVSARSASSRASRADLGGVGPGVFRVRRGSGGDRCGWESRPSVAISSRATSSVSPVPGALSAGRRRDWKIENSDQQNDDDDGEDDHQRVVHDTSSLSDRATQARQGGSVGNAARLAPASRPTRPGTLGSRGPHYRKMMPMAEERRSMR